MTEADTLEPPFEYQNHISRQIVRNKHCPVIAPPGSGKTRGVCMGLISAEITAHVNGHVGDPDDETHPILVLCSGPAIPTWVRQMQKWYGANPEDIHVVRHVPPNPQKRADMWAQAHEQERGIYITNFAIFRKDFEKIYRPHYKTKKPVWKTVVADEYHKAFRRRNKTFNRFATLTRHVPYVIPTSGSVMRKDPSSLFTVFNICDPKLPLFRSYHRFVNTFCIVIDNGWGDEIVGPKNLERLRALMDERMAYIPEKVVADQLPEGKRVPVEVQLTAEQQDLYGQYVEEMVAMFEDGSFDIVSSRMGIQLKLRQLLCCPKIINPDLGMGGGYERIRDLLEESDDKHCVIFVPFRLACDYIKEALEMEGYDVGILRGQISEEEQTEVIEQFKETEGIIVCTIAYAESFDLETCKTSYFLGYDYTVDQNRQAEGRTRRVISHSRFCTWNYIKYLGTVDEKLLENLDAEQRMFNRILDRPEEYIKALKGE